MDVLKQAFGSLRLSARMQSDPSKYTSERSYADLRFDEYLSLLAKSDSNELPYAANNRVDPRTFQILGIEHRFNDLGKEVKDPNMWIGPAGAATPLHKDSTDNGAIQIFGRKQWTLYSISDHDSVDVVASKYGSYAHPNAEFAVSALSYGNSEVKRVSPFSSPRPHIVTIDEGDLLYIPYGWGHAVENTSTSIMLNVWFALDNYRPLIVTLQNDAP